MSQTDIIHTVPQNDMFDHDTSNSDNCVCGPEIDLVKRDDGLVVAHVVHYSFDGREHSEPDHDRDACAVCAHG